MNSTRESLLIRIRGHTQQGAIDANTFARPSLTSNIHLTGRILADENGGQFRHDGVVLNEFGDLFRQFRLDFPGD